MLKRLVAMAASSVLWAQPQSFSSNAFAIGNYNDMNNLNNDKNINPAFAEPQRTSPDDDGVNQFGTVAYRDLKLRVGGVEVPVAMWYPIDEPTRTTTTLQNSGPSRSDIRSDRLYYDYKISIRRIGQLLARWEFIPSFASKDFHLKPTLLSTIVTGKGIDLPSRGPIVLLAHGYLGSRFDLSHLGEALATEGW